MNLLLLTHNIQLFACNHGTIAHADLTLFVGNWVSDTGNAWSQREEEEVIAGVISSLEGYDCEQMNSRTLQRAETNKQAGKCSQRHSFKFKMRLCTANVQVSQK